MSDQVKKISLVKTPGYKWAMHIEAGSNKVTGTAEYTDDLDGWKDRVPTIGTVHPESDALLLKSIDPEGMEGEQVLVKLTYESWDSEASYPGRPASTGKIKRTDGEYSESEEPMLTHKRYLPLLAAERTALSEILAGNLYKDEAGKELWEKSIVSELGLSALAKIKAGQTSVITSGFIFVQRFVSKSLDDLELDKVNKIDVPPEPCPAAVAPANFRRMAPKFSQNEDGKTFNIELRWQLSGTQGWDTDHYPAA